MPRPPAESCVPCPIKCSAAELQALVKRLGGRTSISLIPSVTHILAGGWVGRGDGSWVAGEGRADRHQCLDSLAVAQFTMGGKNVLDLQCAAEAHVLSA